VSDGQILEFRNISLKANRILTGMNLGRVHPTCCLRGTRQPTYYLNFHFSCKFHKTQERGSIVEALFRLVARVGARHRKLTHTLKRHHGEVD
jgi:hypothetical protein